MPCNFCEMKKIFIEKGLEESEAILLASKYEEKEKSRNCVSEKIHELKADHPDWERDQLIKVALKMCGQSRDQ